MTTQPLSSCCKAPVDPIVAGGEIDGYICTSCGEPCSIEQLKTDAEQMLDRTMNTIIENQRLSSNMPIVDHPPASVGHGVEGKKYSIIYADPPWFYHFKGSKKYGDAQVEYPVMKTKDICNLPVGNISADQSVCFIWATMPNLPDALKVMEAWGFKYKTVAFVWVKTTSSGLFRSGTGHFTNSNAEIVIIGTRGNNLTRMRKDIKQILAQSITKHSEKPKEIREKIEQLYGDIPRIELFAREKSAGWDVWGNEVESDIDLTHTS